MDVSRLRLFMAMIAVAMIGSGVALAAATEPATSEPAPPLAVGNPPPSAAAPTLSTSPTPSPSPTTPVLRPDVRSLPASELSIETTAEGRRLRFSATLANDGPGPLELVPLELVPDENRTCPAGQRYAVQRLYHDAGGDGRFDRAADGAAENRAAGCMLDHPDHGHWHFDSMARYALTPLGSTTPAAENVKVSFCLRDNVAVPGSQAGPPLHYGQCDSRLSVQGISPGWADVYTADLADQHLDLPDDLATGTYCLHTEADPLRLLDEIDSTNNAAVLAVQVDGSSVVVAPTNQCRPLPPLE